MKAKSQAKPFDTSRILKDEETIRLYLQSAVDEGDPRYLQIALGNVAKARGMTEMARKTGISRASLYKSLSADGNPEWMTITTVLKALGLRVTVATAEPVAPAKKTRARRALVAEAV